MNKKEKAYLEKLFLDCVKLEKRKSLTEYGAGQGDLCICLLKKKRKPFV
jgi:hypothetical protein